MSPPTESRRAAIACAVLAVVLAISCGAVAADAQSTDGPRPPLAGLPLTDALRALQARGLPIVFTQELVRPSMRVAEEPASGNPRAALDEILAPHGLAVREGPSGVLVVVVADGGEEENGKGGPDEVLARPVIHDEIVVQPSRLSLLHVRPDSTLSLGREEIERIPHLGGDVQRATSLLPGAASNDVSARISVHGGRRDEVMVLLDGQEIYDAYHLHDYDGALGVVPSHSLSAAALTTGGFAADRGDRMSGVLDLSTIDPAPGTGRRLTLGVGVFDLLASGSGRFGERPSGDGGAWLITARRGSLDLARDAVGNEHPSFWDALGKLSYDTPAAGTLTGHFLLAHDDLAIDRTDEDGFERLENDYRSAYGWIDHRVSPERWDERLLIESSASWARLSRDRGSVTEEEEGGFALRDRRDTDVFGLSQSFSLDAGGGHFVRWGAGARRYDARFDYAKDLEQDFVVVAPFAPPRRTVHAFDGDLESDHLGLWASDRLSLPGRLDRLTAELGVRYDRHTLTDDTLWSPRVNLAWRLSDRSVVRAAWGRFFQSQRPYELQVEDGEPSLFRAEHSEHWVLGYEAVLGGGGPLGLAAVRAELFRREIDDPRPRYENLLEAINFFPEIEPDRVRIAPSSSRAQGFELLLRGSPAPRFSWWLSYTWQETEERIAPAGDRDVPRELDQPHALALVTHFRLPRDWNLDLAWRYHTGWPTTPVAIVETGAFRTARGLEEDPDDPTDGDPDDLGDSGQPMDGGSPTLAFGPLRSERLPDYHRLDLRVSRRWDLRRGALTFYLDVQNVYDRENVAGFDILIEEPEGGGDDVFALVPEGWPGLFPSLGIVWEIGGSD